MGTTSISVGATMEVASSPVRTEGYGVSSTTLRVSPLGLPRVSALPRVYPEPIPEWHDQGPPTRGLRQRNRKWKRGWNTTAMGYFIGKKPYFSQLESFVRSTWPADELMSNEQLFFGLSQALRKFPKETDKVLCHFCFKQKKVTNGVLAIDNSGKSQILISSIILLKTALDAVPLLSKALKDGNCFLLRNVYKSICENEKFSMRTRIGEVIDEDVLHARVPFVARTQQCFAVKA
ncbi:DNA mismatch repair protein MSH4 [Sesamum alatum]|uniref:DNA mismatch repair protein MSH4 n=1 Tax=Sesamum alatum TaxID=300844 RepID=A0AAE1XTF2_9LAMI|nr:DNA mismatch repair protein MSH4 [Sesamum alatum]